MFPKQSPEKAAEILKNFVGEMEKKRKEELEEIRTKLGKEKTGVNELFNGIHERGER